MGWGDAGEGGEAGCVTGWGSSGEHCGVECDECEIAGCVISWVNIGGDFAAPTSGHWGHCFSKNRADCRVLSGRRCKCICSCRCSFGLLDGLVSGKVSLDSIGSVFSCSCGGGHCLSQPARQVPQ